MGVKQAKEVAMRVTRAPSPQPSPPAFAGAGSEGEGVC